MLFLKCVKIAVNKILLGKWKFKYAFHLCVGTVLEAVI